MNSKNAVLEAYARADEEQRLYLFLSHRDFRQEFMEIDLAAVGGVQAEVVERSKASQRRGTSLQRAATCCWSWFSVSRS